jgi:hypothetical protein
MIGMEVDELLQKIGKVQTGVADEGIEQRGSFHKVTRASDSAVHPVGHP